MLASPLPSTDVKSDQTFSAEATIQQQQQPFATAGYSPDVIQLVLLQYTRARRLPRIQLGGAFNHPSIEHGRSTPFSERRCGQGSETLNLMVGPQVSKCVLCVKLRMMPVELEEPLTMFPTSAHGHHSHSRIVGASSYRYAPEHSRSLSPQVVPDEESPLRQRKRMMMTFACPLS
ncbi:hypothetical protein Pst134EB_002001 [Puccinia striiformis f. sp. tritici]|nr:hypothetical protein Pst134EB_002001 [Puccinia striiformis f. sp. tritici]